MEQFQYSPLQPSEIRLITLLPGPRTADIEIELYHANLSSDPDYEALSYVWGSPERIEPILVHHDGDDTQEGHVLPITGNLAIALPFLRHSSEKRVLWIDAICINQDDLTERSAEVLKMGNIFKAARRVIVWLGPESNDSELAIETLKMIADCIVLSDHIVIRHRKGSWVEKLWLNQMALRMECQRWIAIKHLLCREWFSRLWVFQELEMATSTVAIVGDTIMPWNDLRQAARWFTSINGLLLQMSPTMGLDRSQQSRIDGYMQAEPGRRGQMGGVSLEFALQLTRNLSCLDPRDRLFAIHGLLGVGGLEHSAIEPDYSRNVQDVYKSSMLRVLERGNAQLLRQCLWPSKSVGLSLPTWVPDFSYPDLPVQVPWYFRASGHSKAHFRYHQSEDRLSVQGIKIVTLKLVAEPVTQSNSSFDILDIARGWQRLNLDAYHGNYAPDKESRFRNFFEAILCGYIEGVDARQYIPFPLRDCQQAFDTSNSDEENESSMSWMRTRFVNGLDSMLRGRTYFDTGRFIGVCPESARSNDELVVILGCSAPLILRQVSETPNRYRVIGESYVPGIMGSEGLLGSLPRGWSLCYEVINGWVLTLYKHSEKVTQVDPRVALPPGWRPVYGNGDNTLESEPQNLQEMETIWFENVETKEKTRFDPRLTPELLRARGVDVQEFCLE